MIFSVKIKGSKTNDVTKMSISSHTGRASETNIQLF